MLMSYMLARWKVKTIALCVPTSHWCNVDCTKHNQTLSKRTGGKRARLNHGFRKFFGNISMNEANTGYVWHETDGWDPVKRGHYCNIEQNWCYKSKPASASKPQVKSAKHTSNTSNNTPQAGTLDTVKNETYHGGGDKLTVLISTFKLPECLHRLVNYLQSCDSVVEQIRVNWFEDSPIPQSLTNNTNFAVPVLFDDLPNKLSYRFLPRDFATDAVFSMDVDMHYDCEGYGSP